MLERAVELFSRHGYDGVSMDELAAAAGVSKPMVYAYFGSKWGLYRRCREVVAERFRARIAQGAAKVELPGDQRLFSVLLSVFEFVEENRPLWRLYNAPDAPPRHDETTGQASEAMRELIGRLIVDAARAEGVNPALAELARPFGAMLTAAVLAQADWWRLHPEEPKELQALRVMNFAWVGFGKLIGGELWLPPSPPPSDG